VKPEPRRACTMGNVTTLTLTVHRHHFHFHFLTHRTATAGTGTSADTGGTTSTTICACHDYRPPPGPCSPCARMCPHRPRWRRLSASACIHFYAFSIGLHCRLFLGRCLGVECRRNLRVVECRRQRHWPVIKPRRTPCRICRRIFEIGSGPKCPWLTESLAVLQETSAGKFRTTHVHIHVSSSSQDFMGRRGSQGDCCWVCQYLLRGMQGSHRSLVSKGVA